MKRWAWLAVVPVAVGVAVWLMPDTTDVAIITAIHPDGTIEWVEGEIRSAEENSSAAHETGSPRTSKLAADVEIRTAQGCGAPHDIDLSLFGLGAVPCTKAEFLALLSPPYAPQLTFNGAGEITEIAGRYHP